MLSGPLIISYYTVA